MSFTTISETQMYSKSLA